MCYSKLSLQSKSNFENLNEIPGNVYKMSRNKDKYESNNNRRQQTFMSPEDVAAGKKTSWNSVEITGNNYKAIVY